LHAIDFTTALGRLLRDGACRDSLRTDASNVADELNVRAEDRAAFITLSPTELDTQADVLLRKRLEHVKRLAPELCARLAGNLWQHFRAYARNQWHEDGSQDALHFCEHVLLNDAQIISRTELNRLEFLASGQRMRINFVRDLRVGNRKRSGIQILRRSGKGSVRETWLYLAA
jgi:hypothetical protein